eukprot:322193-Chlamydomonas_euryale.AAC.1
MLKSNSHDPAVAPEGCTPLHKATLSRPQHSPRHNKIHTRATQHCAGGLCAAPQGGRVGQQRDGGAAARRRRADRGARQARAHGAALLGRVDGPPGEQPLQR